MKTAGQHGVQPRRWHRIKYSESCYWGHILHLESECVGKVINQTGYFLVSYIRSGQLMVIKLTDTINERPRFAEQRPFQT